MHNYTEGDAILFHKRENSCCTSSAVVRDIASNKMMAIWYLQQTLSEEW
jgi:hypothetical protein